MAISNELGKAGGIAARVAGATGIVTAKFPASVGHRN